MDYTVEQLLQDGFTIKMAEYYSALMAAERKSDLWSSNYIDWAHSKGFLAESASAYKLDDSNINDYLSDYDYYKVWPLNSWERIWINDKLTLKYLLADTPMDKYLPKYYYYIDSQKGLVPLVDNSIGDHSLQGFKKVLKAVNTLACKPCNGSGSQGFFKLSFSDDKYFMNDKQVCESEIDDFVSTHINFVITEYLLPDQSLASISPLIHTLRLLVINKDFNNPEICGGYLRFANKVTGAANHMTESNADMFDYDVDIDLLTGEFKNGKKVYLNRVEKSPLHPDSNVLVQGKLDCWDEIVDFVTAFAKKYSLCEYLGFDLCVSDKGIKIMEINSHSGIKHIQLARPLLKDEFTRDYYTEKLRMIDDMDEVQMQQRHNLRR